MNNYNCISEENFYSRIFLAYCYIIIFLLLSLSSPSLLVISVHNAIFLKEYISLIIKGLYLPNVFLYYFLHFLWKFINAMNPMFFFAIGLPYQLSDVEVVLDWVFSSEYFMQRWISKPIYKNTERKMKHFLIWILNFYRSKPTTMAV